MQDHTSVRGKRSKSSNPTQRERNRSPIEEIQQRAYEIYLKRGKEPGHQLEDWLQAERELTGK